MSATAASHTHKPIRASRATDWEGGRSLGAVTAWAMSLATPAGFCELLKPGDKVLFIEITLRKSLTGLLPGPGLLTCAFLSSCGTPDSQTPRKGLQIRQPDRQVSTSRTPHRHAPGGQVIAVPRLARSRRRPDCVRRPRRLLVLAVPAAARPSQ